MSKLTESLTLGSADSLTDRVLDALPERGSPTWYVLGLALALFVGFSIYTALMHARFQTTGADLGAYTHMFSSTLQGEGWLQHGKYRASQPIGSYWGAHFSLTLLLFLPLFALVPSVYTLLVAKSFVLAASVVVLWLLARDRLDSDRLAGVVTVSYAFNPFLWSAWSFDFQEQVLIPPFLFAAYYCYQKDRRLLFLGFLALVLFTNEFVIFPTIGFLGGLVVAAAVAGRLKERALPILGAGVLVVVARVVSTAVIDYYSVFGGLPTYVVAEPLQPFIQGMGRVSLVDLALTVLANPLLLLDSATFAVADKLLFFAAFMLPVAFLALFDELSLAALAPYLGFAWVFTGEAKAVYFEFGAHYPLYLLPFVYIGVIHALRRLSGRFDWLQWPSRATFSGLLSAVLVLCLLSGAASGGGHLAVPPPVDEDHRETLEAAIDSIPENASLIAQNDIYPHVATRPNASFIVSPGTFNAYEKRWQPVMPEYLLVDTQLNPNAPWARAVQQTYADRLGDEYGLYRYQDGIQIFKRGYDGPVRGITQPEPGARRYDAANMATGTGERASGTIVSENGSAGDYIWFGPYDTLTPGTYTATFRVNVSGNGSEPVVMVDVAGGDDHGRIASERVAPAPGWQNVTVQFSLNETTSDIEFRGIRKGEGRVALDWVRVSYESKNATANPSGRSP
ncbi:DUF2079 domain-containing protein [Halococcus sp. AFM35]|uniref:DUF2079 domain-containing protein n=1 Tax=Halococcus sp. AFM35 TaxID=3421653 RepID=UPI003EC1340E